MEDATQDAAGAAVEALRGFLERQLEELEDPRNVHTVRERLYGRRWTEALDIESLPEDVEATVTAEVERAWGALSRYPWDLYGAQQALKSAVERAVI